MKIEDFISEIDSERFGFRVAKINNFTFPITDTLDFLKENDFKVVISKIDSANIHLINELEKNGFLIKDFQLTYKLVLDQHSFESKTNLNIKVRDFTKNDIDTLAQIAVHSFVDYGHYANNSIFDINKVPMIYGDWVKRGCLDTYVSDKVFVAEINNKVVGFLSLKVSGNNKCVIDLAAVDIKHRNQNVMKALITHTIFWAKKTQNNWIETKVLATNLPVIKAFSDQKFIVSN
jgi:hypothetical protein